MATRKITSSTSACTKPATQVRAPLLMLVIVRAMAPVAGMPPNSGATMLARPCPTNSWFESCRSPVTPSATVAESKLSIAPSTAMTSAVGSSLLRVEKVKLPSGAVNRPCQSSCQAVTGGSEAVMAPKRSPMVGICVQPCPLVSATTAVVTTMATSEPGRRFEMRCVPTMIPTVESATARAPQLTVVR